MSDIPPAELFHSLSSLPEPGLLLDILLRLPVKSLLRFRSISKSWRALIDSPYFIKKHLNHSIETETNFHIVYKSFNRFYTAPFGSLGNFKPFENHLFSENHETTILGSCNGVLCWSTAMRVHSSSPTITIIKEMALLNPSTRKFKNIPILPVNFMLGSTRRFWIEGFGYDCVNDDYKVVSVVQSIRDNILDSEIRVYSLKLGFWRWIRGFPYYLFHPTTHGVFASGCLHWVVSRQLEPIVNFVIVAFDLASEKYRIVPQPEYSCCYSGRYFGVVSGFLYVVCENSDDSFEIWLLESYGVEESWNKLISISSANKSFDRARLLSFSKSAGKVLMEEDNERLVWYDIKTKTLENVLESRDLFVADVYVGSLAQLNGGSDGGRERIRRRKTI